MFVLLVTSDDALMMIVYRVVFVRSAIVLIEDTGLPITLIAAFRVFFIGETYHPCCVHLLTHRLILLPFL